MMRREMPLYVDCVLSLVHGVEGDLLAVEQGGHHAV